MNFLPKLLGGSRLRVLGAPELRAELLGRRRGAEVLCFKRAIIENSSPAKMTTTHERNTYIPTDNVANLSSQTFPSAVKGAEKVGLAMFLSQLWEETDRKAQRCGIPSGSSVTHQDTPAGLSVHPKPKVAHAPVVAPPAKGASVSDAR